MSTPRGSRGSSSNVTSTSRFREEGRFLPGTVVADRHRIVALLGRGGMGEVYRADDLSLGQPVALKFVPDAIKDSGALERLRAEVRIARRISHPNVCRVYDIGEAEGHVFLSMEYIDGEDLASLLRRIGRIPEDKALEIARQVCAGLAAAHDKGVLHRDLKPSNVMLDGRGQALIMDFGLSTVADELQASDIGSGTPAYMAPEQLEGKEVTVKSDIYSLGLLLYEVFTGRRAFSGKTLEEIVRSRASETATRPSTLVKDFNPTIERAILRCLETDPALRPGSVLSVAAALPGGDPLAAALAAGETPSPEVVAAAGENVVLSIRAAVGCIVAVALGLIALWITSDHLSGYKSLGLDYSPEVMQQKARDMLAVLGYNARPVDSAGRYDFDFDLIDYIERNDGARPDWGHILQNRPSVIKYWYRSSPDYLVTTDFLSDSLTPGVITPSSPPPTLSGMTEIDLDAGGHLIHFEAVPPQVAHDAAPGTPVNWADLFAAAGLNIKNFQQAQPTWNPLAATDTRLAWTGQWPGSGRNLRIEAASLHGKPVFFSLIGDWTKPSRVVNTGSSGAEKARGLLLVSLLSVVLIGGVFVARRNYRLGRGDRQGTLRLAIVVFALQLSLLLLAHLVASSGLILLIVVGVSTAMFNAAMAGILYLAIEPAIRKRWPQALVSWARLLSGRVPDPHVARDVLFGIILALLWDLIFRVNNLVLVHQGAPPNLGNSFFLGGTRNAIAGWLFGFTGSVKSTLIFFFVLFLMRWLLRREWLATIGFVLIFATLKFLGSRNLAIDIPTIAAVYLIAAIASVRFGLVTLATALFVADALVELPMAPDSSAWFFSLPVFAYLATAAMTGWAFYVSLGGRRLFNADALG